jgi:hypothetical protein
VVFYFQRKNNVQFKNYVSKKGEQEEQAGIDSG